MKRLLFCLLLLPFFSFAQKDFLIPYREINKWGFCDTSKNVIVKPVYDSVGNFANGAIYTIVRKDNKTGVFNRLTRTEIVPMAYDSIKILYPGGHIKSDLFYIKQNGKTGVVEAGNRMIIEPVYDEIGHKGDGEEKNLVSHFILKMGNKYGIADKNGKMLTQFIYDYLRDSYQFGRDSPEQEFYGKLNNKSIYLHIGKDGKVRTNNDDEEEAELESSGFGSVEEVTDSGKKIINLTANETQKAFLNKYKLDNIYNDTIPVSTPRWDLDYRRCFKVVKNHKIGILDIKTDSVTIFKKKYKTFYHVFAYENRSKAFYAKYKFRKLIIVGNKKKIGVIDEKENIRFPFKIDKIIDANFTYLIYQTNKKLGIYDYFSQAIKIQPVYTSIKKVDMLGSKFEPFEIFLVRKDGKWGYLGMNGTEYFVDK